MRRVSGRITVCSKNCEICAKNSETVKPSTGEGGRWYITKILMSIKFSNTLLPRFLLFLGAWVNLNPSGQSSVIEAS